MVRLIFLTLLVASCANDPSSFHPDAQTDASDGSSAKPDASDVGVHDTGIDTQDASTDSGVQDARIDAGMQDASPDVGVHDTGVDSQDAQTDAGTDTGTGIDTGIDTQDAGLSDTGSNNDASPDASYVDSGSPDADAGTNDGGPLANVPGEVVYWRESPFSRFWPAPNRIYTTSPSIALLPSGAYLISFNLFGGSLNPSSDVSGTTYIYRSTDRGLTWANLTPQPMMDMKRGSLVVFGGDLYLWGYAAAPGDIIIRRSTDEGSTWTTPSMGTTGLLKPGGYGGTPGNPVVHNGRLWLAEGGKRLMSISTASEFLTASLWAGPSNVADTESGPFGSGLTVTEAQIVAAPHTGVVVLPKVGGLPYTVLIRATGDDSVAHPQDLDWIELPGGEKKFGAAYDAVSGRFYVLSNPVLAAHANHSTPQMIRNTAAMLSSTDLIHWDVEQIFLYTENIDYEAFQYFNFDFDGDDLIIVSRTAFDIGGRFLPPRGHDSNLITFHRIANFRTAAPHHVLRLDGARVERFEQTQHQDAPLGDFVLGDHFDGAPLGIVAGFGVMNGAVYLEEQGGRILRFDALGNFVEVVTTSPVSFQTTPMPIAQPDAGERAWTCSFDGRWSDLENWYYWGRPDTTAETANLGSAITAARTITVDRTYRMKGIRFRSANSYTIAGSGSIEIASQSGTGLLQVEMGTHTVQIPVRLDADVVTTVHSATVLQVQDVDLNGYALSVAGTGRLELASFAMGSGQLVLDGASPLVFLQPSAATLDGVLAFQPATTVTLSLGTVIQLLDFGTGLTGTFTNVVLPALSSGLAWDTTRLYVDGTVEIIPD